MKKYFYLLFLLIASSITADIDEPGQEKIEIIEGQQVLYLKGTPYQIGFQHGSLLRDQIAHNISRFIDQQLAGKNVPPHVKEFMDAIPQVITHIPKSLLEELQGIAEGSGLPYEKILLLNLFPEMFHCSAITVKDKASERGTLYHARVLDYSIGKYLQDTAVLMVVTPEKGIPFLNVTYAGFIGCVTGMNKEKIAIGEIGGKGYGSWNGVPMAFLLRHILENASNLSEVQEILESTPRTCEYYYIFSDGKTKETMAAYTTASKLSFIYPGQTYAIISPHFLSTGEQGTQIFLNDLQIEKSPYQTLIYSSENKLPIATLNVQPEDCLVLTRFNNYSTIIERLMHNYGNLALADLLQIIKRPVAADSNLHNAIFAPETLDVWISHAGPNNEPACDQGYSHFNLKELLK